MDHQTIITVPRTNLAHTHYKDIDAILKDLKFCSRRLKAALDSFKDELRVLERLYYKCKNQHRMALFFKRVPEIRRYGQRLNQLDILERVDLLRASFFGLEDTSEWPKGTQGILEPCTPATTCLFFKGEIDDLFYSDLYSEIWFNEASFCPRFKRYWQMRERLERAYHHFTLAMQSGAFVQLIILFVAISSRLSMLSSELVEVVQLGISTCNRLLAVIHPTAAQATTSQQLSSESRTRICPSQVDYDAPLEDTGETIFRHDPVDTSWAIVEKPGTEIETILEVIESTLPPRHPANDNDRTAVQVPKNATTKVAQKPRLKKTKKKFDEIDEIFGF